MPTPPSRLRVGQLDRINVFFHYRRYIRMVTQRWGLLLACVVVSVGIGAWHAFTSPDQYRAISRLGVAPRLQTAYQNQAQYLEELKYFYDSQLQYIQGSAVMQRVEDKLRAGGVPVGGLPAVSAKALKGPGYFNLVVESGDFEHARRFAKAWAREFIAYKSELRGNAVDKTAAATRADILRLEANLEKARAALVAFQRQHNIGSAKETGDAAQQRLDKLEAEYQDIVTLRQRLENKTKEDIANGALVEAARPAPPATGNAPAPGANNSELTDPLAKFAAESRYTELKLRLRAKEAEWTRLSATLKPAHPFMIELARELEQRRLEVAAQLELIEEKRLARVKSLRADEESYRPIIETLRRQVLESRSVQYEFERLKDEENSVKTVLESLRKTLTSIDLAVSDENLFTIMEEGIGSSVPVSPDRPKILLLALGAGLLLGWGLIYSLDKLDDRLDIAEEIQEALGEPVLGMVPQVGGRGQRPANLLMTQFDEHSLFAESLRGVRSGVLLGFQGDRKKVLIVSSAVPGDGKTTFTVNFALTLALAGYRVLLVDADLRRGNTHNYFGQARGPGLTEVLAGEWLWTDAVRTTEHDTLHVLPSGRLPANPGELLIRPLTRQFIDEAREAYDFVVFDCTPLTGIDDAFSLAGAADGLLFVVRAGQTSMRFARGALAAVRQRGARVLGLVVNGITSDNPHYYYSNYYHSLYNRDLPAVTAMEEPRGELETVSGSARNPAA
jgi:capsular exopolysaccharide synthesis family protein